MYVKSQSQQSKGLLALAYLVVGALASLALLVPAFMHEARPEAVPQFIPLPLAAGTVAVVLFAAAAYTHRAAKFALLIFSIAFVLLALSKIGMP